MGENTAVAAGSAATAAAAGLLLELLLLGLNGGHLRLAAAAAEAGLEVGGDAPVMTEAVGPLVTAVVGKMRPPDWISLQLAGSTVSLWARKKSIPKMAVETSANKKLQVKC